MGGCGLLPLLRRRKRRGGGGAIVGVRRLGKLLVERVVHFGVELLIVANLLLSVCRNVEDYFTCTHLLVVDNVGEVLKGCVLYVLHFGCVCGGEG